MIPPSFEYLTPSKISDAIAMLQKHGEEAKILAGGHSLIPAMRLRLSEPGYLIDISGIQGLDYILEESGQLRIGAMTREASLEESQIVWEKYPLLLDTAKMIADLMELKTEIRTDAQRLRPKKSEVERLCADNAKAKKLLEWEPKYGGTDGFRKGLAKTIEWITDPSNLLTYKSDKYNI